MNAFAEDEYGTFMDTLFYYWQSMRMPHSLISMVSSFRPREIFSEADMERYHGVDVRPVEPPNFVMREHPGVKWPTALAILAISRSLNFHRGFTQRRLARSTTSAGLWVSPNITRLIKLSAVIPGDIGGSCSRSPTRRGRLCVSLMLSACSNPLPECFEYDDDATGRAK